MNEKSNTKLNTVFSIGFIIVVISFIITMITSLSKESSIYEANLYKKQQQQENICKRALQTDKTWKDSLFTVRIINCPETVDDLVVNPKPDTSK